MPNCDFQSFGVIRGWHSKGKQQRDPGQGRACANRRNVGSGWVPANVLWWGLRCWAAASRGQAGQGLDRPPGLGMQVFSLQNSGSPGKGTSERWGAFCPKRSPWRLGEGSEGARVRL